MERSQGGVAVLCDLDGLLLRTLRDDLGLSQQVAPGQPFTALVASRSFSHAEAFLKEIRESEAALDWEFDVTLNGQTREYYFSGGQTGDHVLIVGTASRSEVNVRFYEELMRINNEQTNALRSALKELTLRSRDEKEQSSRDARLYDELTRLNNELVAVQRDLAKHNTELVIQRRRYRILSEMISDYAYALRVDPDGDITCEWITGAFHRITGYRLDEVRDDAGLDALLALEDRDVAGERMRRLLAGESDAREFPIITKTGERRWILDYRRPEWDEELGRVVRVYGAAQDITQRKELEAQLQAYALGLEDLVDEKVRELEMERAKVLHSAKLAAIGEMATGVAHELNQPLTAILFEADYLAQLGQQGEGVLERVPDLWGELVSTGENLAGDVARCRRIVDHLRTFGRVTKPKRELVCLNQPIEDSFILIGERLRQHEVDVEFQFDPDLPAILADGHRLEQIFLNLISNAEHAMEKKEELIKLGEVDLPGYRKRLEIATYVEADAVVATLSDNGCGIPPEAQEHIFEPFFTTKPEGEGTGLGLSISYGIVKEFDGEIAFVTAENEGTTFTLRFPIAPDGGMWD